MTRWISGIILALIVLGILFFLPGVAIQGVVVVLCMVAAWEYFTFVGGYAGPAQKIPGVLTSGVVCALLIFGNFSQEYFAAIFFILFLIPSILHFRGTPDLAARIRNLGLFHFGLVYTGFLFAFWGWVVVLPRWKFWVFLMLAATFLADTGAYLVGHAIGRHKLAPRLSPGKTVEGLLGGWVFAVLAGFIVRFLFWPDYPMGLVILITSLIAVMGPLGDLTESLLKRGVNVKDSGTLVPGHGGLLDRVDALLFTVPVVYFFAKFL